MRHNPWSQQHNLRLPSPTSLTNDPIPTHSLSSEFFPAQCQSFIKEPVPLQQGLLISLGKQQLWSGSPLTNECINPGSFVSFLRQDIVSYLQAMGCELSVDINGCLAIFRIS